LIPALDDDTVVVNAGVTPGRCAGAIVSDFIDVDDYLSGREEMRRRELVWGVVREPSAPRYGHQAVVTSLAVLLSQHVRNRALGEVCVSPADVVLDREQALIVQPDVFFIAAARMDIVRDQVWGAPDLVVEVASPGHRALRPHHQDRVVSALRCARSVDRQSNGLERDGRGSRVGAGAGTHVFRRRADCIARAARFPLPGTGSIRVTRRACGRTEIMHDLAPRYRAAPGGLILHDLTPGKTLTSRVGWRHRRIMHDLTPQNPN
jgi:hypothetical protein